MRCMTCRFWQGDKEEARKLLEENELSMDLFKGWPNSGGCGIEYEWLESTVHGDAFVVNEVSANFSCPYWGAEPE